MKKLTLLTDFIQFETNLKTLFSAITQNHFGLSKLTENMAAVLTNTYESNQVKGMSFLTEIIKKLPKDHLSEMEIKFLSKFYADKLKDHHSVVPSVLQGYLSIIEMENYNVQFCSEFLTTLFSDVPCQSQDVLDRYNIYCIIKRLFEKDFECKFNKFYLA